MPLHLPAKAQGTYDPTFVFGCTHCGRIWDCQGKGTGFVKAGHFRHEHACASRTPKQRRAVNRRDEIRWKRGSDTAIITNAPDHPGLQDK